MSSMYDKMKARGIDMSWYERSSRRKSGVAAPLDDQECSLGSIYLVKADGTLWTINLHGDPHKQVRASKGAIAAPTLLCLHCRTQFSAMPSAHSESEGQQLTKGGDQ